MIELDFSKADVVSIHALVRVRHELEIHEHVSIQFQSTHS